ncbi:hypothetical protein FRC05_007990 [Tulasnella sp. 425]|nr:hypothetical protein FRC05_007990 [Tulasnella sp. 425]
MTCAVFAISPHSTRLSSTGTDELGTSVEFHTTSDLIAETYLYISVMTRIHQQPGQERDHKTKCVPQAIAE